MAVTITPRDEDPILRARGLTTVHRTTEAEAAYREALLVAPDNAEALNFVGLCELGRGNFDSALRRFERAVRIDASEAGFRKNLGIAQLALGRAQDAIDTFDQAIAMDPKELATHLHRAAALEQLGNSYEATATYYRAIAAAQASFQWRTRQTTPPLLQPLVRHAIDYITRHRRQIYLDLMQPAREEYGAAALARVEHGLALYLKENPEDPAQAGQVSSFFHVPGLPAQPLLDASRIPGLDALAAQAATLHAELEAAIADGQAIEPCFGSDDLALLREAGVLDGPPGARLDALYLYRDGEPEPAGRNACPRAFAAVAALPTHIEVANLGPDAYFALLAPGTHVLESTGITNARIGVEIPLRVDGECIRRAGGVDRAWRVGEPIAYAGSSPHELWNRGGGTCAALMLDAWHPDLTAAERMALTALFEGISQFHLAAGVEPPFGA